MPPDDWRFCGEIFTGPTFSSVDFYTETQWTDEFREQWLTLASSGSGDMVGIATDVMKMDPIAPLSHCSKGLCLRYFSIEQRDLQRQDFCNPGRNTGHLRMDVGNRSEPELHA